MTTTIHTGEKNPRIVRRRVDSLTLYEITDNELDILEKGSPASLYLNFAVFFVSTGLSFLVALLTTSLSDMRVWTTFVVITVIGLFIGVFLLVLWIRTRESVSAVIKRIKERTEDGGSTSPPTPARGTPQPATTEQTDAG